MYIEYLLRTRHKIVCVNVKSTGSLLSLFTIILLLDKTVNFTCYKPLGTPVLPDVYSTMAKAGLSQASVRLVSDLSVASESSVVKLTVFCAQITASHSSVQQHYLITSSRRNYSQNSSL